MTEHTTIETFSGLWWISNSITFSTIFIIIYFSKIINKKNKSILCIIISTILFLRIILIHPYHLMIGDWTYQTHLPLHLCGLSSIISSFILIYRNQILYELLVYWGISGAFHSFLTPEFTGGSEGILFYEYYISHGGIILAAFYLTIVDKMKPRTGSWLSVFLYSQLLIPIIGFINYVLDANYMYLCTAPIVNNPFIFTNQWPWYIVGIDIAAILHFYIIYYIFNYKYRKK